MKRFLKLILCLIITLFSFGNTNLFGQKIIEYKGDTLIVITPKNVATMNSIIIEREYLIEEVDILSTLVSVKDSIIMDQSDIIKISQESLLETKKRHNLVIQEQAVTWKKEVWKWSGISAGIGILVGILISR